MKRLGVRIKKRRELLHMQLNDLAKRVGISPSALSQIENAKAFPSVLTLKSIANQLNSTVGELIGENENFSQNPLLKSEELIFLKKNKSKTELFLLSHPDPIKQMETYLIRFEQGSNLEGFFVSHVGQAFCFVLEGEFEFLLDETIYSLKQGDSFFFNTVLPFEAHLIQGTTGRLICVITPPGA